MYEVLNEREPDAGAFEGPAASTFDPVKPFEPLGELVGRNAGAGVLHRELDAIFGRLEANLDLALERELEGIRDQVEDDLLPLRSIDVHGFTDRRDAYRELQPRGFDERLK